LLVLDASVAVGWFVPDERRAYSLALLERVAVDGAFVPALFRWEIQSALLGAERANRIDPDDVDRAMDLLRDLPVVVDPSGERIFAGSELHLARYYHLTPYDAAYLALAASRRIPLATLDTALAHAARDIGIEIYSD
jgi:predicted nucleic acid-binding protein